MQNIYEESLNEWKKFFKSEGDNLAFNEIKKRIDVISSGKPYKSDIKDYFVYEIINSVDISKFDTVVKYVHKKITD